MLKSYECSNKTDFYIIIDMLLFMHRYDKGFRRLLYAYYFVVKWNGRALLKDKLMLFWEKQGDKNDQKTTNHV